MADRALMVGINKYPTCPLSKCVRDVERSLDGIQRLFRFDPKGIRLLIDERATTANILTRLQWLVDGVSPGDRLLFLYSGHGAQVATRNKAGEVDGLDEVICPVDFDWSDERLIRDKQFSEIFRTVPKGVEFVWVSDSCHSGDLQRSLKSAGRCMRPPADIAWRNKAAAGMLRGGFRGLGLNVALISGCKSDEVSMEAEDGGAMTTALWNVLEKYPTLKLSAVMTRVVRAVKGQTPTLCGPADIVSVPFLATPKTKKMVR